MDDLTAAGVKRRPFVVVVAHGAPGLHLAGSQLGRLVDALRRRGDLAGAEGAFVHGEPALSVVLAASGQAASLCVVPIFAADGHYTRVVRGRVDAARAASPHRALRQAPALGTVPAFTRVMAARVRRMLRERGVATSQAAFVALGHGQRRASRRADDAAQLLAAMLRPDFAASDALYLEGEPAAGDWSARLDQPDIVVAPLFFSDATHARVDVPQLFGRPVIGSGAVDACGGPWRCNGRRIWMLALPLDDREVAAGAAA